MVEMEANIPMPITPHTPITMLEPSMPQAPKKPRGKVLEFLRPMVYRLEDNATSNASVAHKVVVDELSRAGVWRAQSISLKKGERKECPAARKLLVAIVDGKTDITIQKYVPARLLMQISSNAAEMLEPRPGAGKFRIWGKYDLSTLNGVLEAIVLGHDIPVATGDNTSSLVANLLTYEACLRLGISNTHVSIKALLKKTYAQLSKSAITPAVLHFVTYRLGPKDAVFKHTANVLCYQRFTKSIPDVGSFERMVARKPALQKAMVQIDQTHKARRKAMEALKQKSNGKYGEAGNVNGAHAPALGEMVEATVSAAAKGRYTVTEDGKKALLAILKAEQACEKGGKVGGARVEKGKKTEKVA